MGFELMTSSLPRMRSTPELHRHFLERGRRIELPFSAWKADIIAVIRTPQLRKYSLPLRGQGWIRTTVGVRQQIYSLPHLATLVLALIQFCDEPMEGIEPTTLRLQITRSGHLSYIGSMSMPLFYWGLQRYSIFSNLQKLLQDFFDAFCVEPEFGSLFGLGGLRHEAVAYAKGHYTRAFPL